MVFGQAACAGARWLKYPLGFGIRQNVISGARHGFGEIVDRTANRLSSRVQRERGLDLVRSPIKVAIETSVTCCDPAGIAIGSVPFRPSQ